MTTKVCKTCKVEKETTEFYKQGKNRKHKLGVYAICKECCREKARNKYKEDPEHRKAIIAKHFEKNPRAKRNTGLRHKYGITLDDYDKMYKSCNGKCQICGKKVEKLDVDHCHDTNKVRGLLCGDCNRGLGLFHENKKALLKAVEYLKRG